MLSPNETPLFHFFILNILLIAKGQFVLQSKRHQAVKSRPSPNAAKPLR